MKKLNRKGFTLVELLAVIIILAVVVGITIPAILTTTDKAKDKSFQSAADSAADWFDRQYSVALINDPTIATVDSNFSDFCKNTTDSSTGVVTIAGECIAGKNLDATTVVAAGLKATNIDVANSKVTIDAGTGRTCVELAASSTGDYANLGTKKSSSCS